jgi:hypothetical protein
MPFNNDIAGGNGQLVRNWLQSDNYVAGVSGWRISKNGNAEFNNGTFRGSIEVGSLTGEHFWVNNPNTGDVIDVYNTANKNVFSIDSTGRLVATSSIDTRNIVINGGNLLFEDTAQTPITQNLINGSVAPDGSAINLFSARPQNYVGSGQGAFISINTGDTPASELLSAEQRGVQGALVLSDQSVGAGLGQMMHIAVYLNIVTDASGNSNFLHNCPFTPIVGFLVSDSTAGSDFYQYVWLDPPFTANNANAHFVDRLGNAKVSTTLKMTFGLFIG